MSTYTPFTKTDQKFMAKRLEEVIDKLQLRAYDISGELEVMDLDEDGKNFRQDAVLDIERYLDELRPMVRGLDNVVRTYKNAAPLTAIGKEIRIKENLLMNKYPSMRELDETAAMARAKQSAKRASEVMKKP